ncbi:hypothetical protein [Desulfatibacillum aliphaticivorans]|uniref:hypothetical protein n=1 Tax=Desulfatibacillum aliphaticivorans TaxID=218208 RepID=UPI00040F400E|nr:hypothetical protein [Desulfatibacillum aliphaticivorans]
MSLWPSFFNLVQIFIGILFISGWSREGLRNLLGLAKGLDSTLAAAHQRLSDENQEEADENSESFKE